VSRTLSGRLLDSLDELICHYGLHVGAVDLPVSVASLLEAVSSGYCAFPEKLQAVTMRWNAEDDGALLTDIAYNVNLREFEASAQRRYVEAHEFAHLFCKHRGNFFVLWRRREIEPFAAFLDDQQERQCDSVASYILVRLAALREFRSMSSHEIALMLDVPVELVELRWSIWRKYGR
jgi:Zn-dependent peptidase ImmA (M78 family)